MLIVTNLGTEPAHLEVGEVLGGLQPALVVEDLARPTDMRGAEDFHPQGESIGVDVPSMMQVAAVRSDTGRERVKQLLDALSMDQLEVSMAKREKLQELVEDFTALFALDNSELGRTTVASHSIKTGDHPPVKQQPRRVPFSLRRKVCELTQEMLAQGVIVPSSSPWASPIVLKKDGTKRFCIDYRKLNAITKLDMYPLLRIDDSLDLLADTKYFSSLDLASGYWQVGMTSESQEKTAFTTHVGLRNNPNLCCPESSEKMPRTDPKRD